MKQKSEILLYDDYCPMCSWYSALFVKCGLLDPESRVGFSKADEHILSAIDIERGKNEIPLFDKRNGKALYGIDALLEILSWKIPIIKPVGNIRPVKWFLKKLYKFISYNRKVIVAKKCGKGLFDCSPEFNGLYRVLFMSIFFIFNSVMLLPIHNVIFSGLSFYQIGFEQLQTAHLLFVFANCMIASTLKQTEAIEYLGQINMLAVITILLLTALMMINAVVVIPEWMIIIFLLLVTLIIVKEYFRRMIYANVLSRHKKIIPINLTCLVLFLCYVFH